MPLGGAVLRSWGHGAGGLETRHLGRCGDAAVERASADKRRKARTTLGGSRWGRTTVVASRAAAAGPTALETRQRSMVQRSHNQGSLCDGDIIKSASARRSVVSSILGTMLIGVYRQSYPCALLLLAMISLVAAMASFAGIGKVNR